MGKCLVNTIEYKVFNPNNIGDKSVLELYLRNPIEIASEGRVWKLNRNAEGRVQPDSFRLSWLEAQFLETFSCGQSSSRNNEVNIQGRLCSLRVYRDSRAAYDDWKQPFAL